MPFVSAVLGNVWSMLSPWKAGADAVGWLVRSEAPPFEYPERWGRWPGAVMLLSFVTLELTYPNPSDPRVLALAIAVYSIVTWFGAAAFGSETWFRNGDAFSVCFMLFSRIAPLARRQEDDRLVARTPFSG